MRAFSKPSNTSQSRQLPGRKLPMAASGHGPLALSANPKGHVRMMATPYVGQKADLKGCAHAGLDMLDMPEMPQRLCWQDITSKLAG